MKYDKGGEISFWTFWSICFRLNFPTTYFLLLKRETLNITSWMGWEKKSKKCKGARDFFLFRLFFAVILESSYRLLLTLTLRTIIWRVLQNKITGLLVSLFTCFFVLFPLIRPVQNGCLKLFNYKSICLSLLYCALLQFRNGFNDFKHKVSVFCPTFCHFIHFNDIVHIIIFFSKENLWMRLWVNFHLAARAETFENFVSKFIYCYCNGKFCWLLWHFKYTWK